MGCPETMAFSLSAAAPCSSTRRCAKNRMLESVALFNANRLSSISAMFLPATSRTKSLSSFRLAPAPPVPIATVLSGGAADDRTLVSSDFEQPPMTMAATVTHNSPGRLIASSQHDGLLLSGYGAMTLTSAAKAHPPCGLECREREAQGLNQKWMRLQVGGQARTGFRPAIATTRPGLATASNSSIKTTGSYSRQGGRERAKTGEEDAARYRRGRFRSIN